MNSIHSRGIWLTLLAISVGCSGGGGGGGGGGSATSTAGTLIALSTSNRLISFNPGAPQTVIATLTISGLQSGENIVAIDSRPSTGELLGLGSTSRLYRINPDTGSATAISAGPFTPALTGTDFGFDVDPVGDVVRVTSTTDQNLRLNPQTGAVTMADTTLAYAPGDPNAAMDPNVVGLAYTNDVSGAATTTLYGIDSTADVLVQVGSAGGSPISPDAGQLFTIGALGVDASGLVGFDVTPAGAAYACFTGAVATDSQLYTINLANGVATLIATIGGGETIRGLAARPTTLPRIFAVTSDDRLVAFKPGTPGTIDSTHTITNLQAGETIRAIDFRPSTGEIVGLGSSSRLYTIDKNTGAATAIGVGAFTPVLTGTEFGMDFGPTFDTLRVVSDTGQNLRLDPNAGTIGFADTALVYAAGDPNFSTPPTVVALANSNNFSGTTSSLAYGIDSGLDVLVTLGSAVVPPGNGKLFTIGALGVDASTLAGFDISSDGAAYAALTGPGGVSSQLYTIDLSTGAATLVATIGGTATIRDIAVEPPADPLIYGVTTDNHLVSFLIGRPGTLSSNSAISGLQPSENVLTIDFRPSTGDLVAVGSSSRLYRVSRSSGAATVIGSGPFTPVLSGVEFGADFNPFADALRVVSDAGQNLRLNPNTGAVAATDTMLEFASGDPNFGFPPIVVGIAYNSNVPGATATALYGIDSSIDILVTIGTTGESPNLGHVFSMGGLGIDTTDVAGLDIATNGAAFALINPSVGGSSELRTINLVTGAATLIGSIAGTALRDIAVPPTGL